MERCYCRESPSFMVDDMLCVFVAFVSAVVEDPLLGLDVWLEV